MKKDITEIYCLLNDFCKIYKKYEEAKLIAVTGKRRREGRMSLSEMLTIMVMFHTLPMRNFKCFYLLYIKHLYNDDFSGLLSYNRLIELMPRLLLPFNILLHMIMGEESGTYFIDATSIAVCHNKRKSSNKIFAGLAKYSKSTMGYFHGFKLHIIINHKREFVTIKMTKGNIDDRLPVLAMTKDLLGKIYADKGYIKQGLFDDLFKIGLKLIHGIKKNMKNKLMDLDEKFMLKKRNVIETVFDYLKNKMQIQHTRHRSPINAFVHTIFTLVAYSLKSSKPSIKSDPHLLTHPLIPN